MRAAKSFFLFPFLFALASCGGGGGGGDVAPPPPLTISVSPSTATLGVGETVQFFADVNRSNATEVWYVNDVQGGNSAVGTISSSGLYTAPSSQPNPNTVTVKAVPDADKTKSASAAVTVVTFAISPPSPSVEVGQTQQFTTTLPAALWQVNGVSGGNAIVGTISSSGLYTAPANVPLPATVAVTTYRHGNPNTTAQATVTITPSSQAGDFTLTPDSATVAAGATQQFTASVAVDWEVIGAAATDAGTWGTISSSGLYTAPVTPPWTGTVTIKATSQADSSKTATATVAVTFSNHSLQGDYAFRYRTAETSGDLFVFAVGRFAANGQGAISNGLMDSVMLGGTATTPITAAPFTGTYTVEPDGRVTASFSVQIGGATQTMPLRFVLFDNRTAQMISFDDTSCGWGTIEQQDTSSFAGGLAGTYVFMFDGIESTDLHPYAAAGMFTTDPAGTLSGTQDLNFYGITVASGVPFGGTFDNPDAGSGRGNLNLAVPNGSGAFVYYQLSEDSFVFTSIGGSQGGLVGIAVRRDPAATFSNASLDGGVGFFSQGYIPVQGEPRNTTMVRAGRFVADGGGANSTGWAHTNTDGTVVAGAGLAVNYSIASDGRGTASFALPAGTTHLGLYMISDNNAFFVSMEDSNVSPGQFLAQTGGPFSLSMITQNWAFTWRETFTAAGTDVVGQFNADGAGHFSGTEDVNASGTTATDVLLNGGNSMETTGNGGAIIEAQGSPRSFGAIMISPQLMLMIGIDQGSAPALGVAYRRF